MRRLRRCRRFIYLFIVLQSAPGMRRRLDDLSTHWLMHRFGSSVGLFFWRGGGFDLLISVGENGPVLPLFYWNFILLTWRFMTSPPTSFPRHKSMSQWDVSSVKQLLLLLLLLLLLHHHRLLLLLYCYYRYFLRFYFIWLDLKGLPIER